MADTLKMTWEYLAGFTDGDGSIAVYPRKYSLDPRVSWEQTDGNTWVLVHLVDFLESHNVSYNVHKRESKNGGIRVRVAVNAHNHVLYVLENLIPHLILKKDAAVEVKTRLEALPDARWRKLHSVGG